MKKEIKSGTLIHSDISVLTVSPSDGSEPFSNDLYDQEAKQLLEFLAGTFAVKTLYHLSNLLKKHIVEATAVVFVKDGDGLAQIDPKTGKPSAFFKKGEPI